MKKGDSASATGLGDAGTVYALSTPHAVGSSTRGSVLSTLNQMDRVEVLQEEYGSSTPPAILIRSQQSKDRGLMQTIAQAGRFDVTGWALDPATVDSPPNGDLPPLPDPTPPYYKITPASGRTVSDLESQIASEYSEGIIERVASGAVFVRTSIGATKSTLSSLPRVGNVSGTRSLPQEMNGGNGGGDGNGNGGSGNGNQIVAGVSNTTLLVGAGAAATGLIALVASS